MISQDNLFGLFSKLYDSHKETEMSLEDYLKCCAREPMAYASTAERMLAAIGEPEIVDTSRDSRMGRIFMNRSIRIYPSFADFYGMEETIERIVGYFRHAAQEIPYDPLDRLLHAVEIGEGWINADRTVHEDATHPRVAAGVDDLRLADGGKHPFGSAGVSHRLTSAAFQIGLKRHFSLFMTIVQLRKETEQIILRNHPPPRP